MSELLWLRHRYPEGLRKHWPVLNQTYGRSTPSMTDSTLGCTTVSSNLWPQTKKTLLMQLRMRGYWTSQAYWNTKCMFSLITKLASLIWSRTRSSTTRNTALCNIPKFSIRSSRTSTFTHLTSRSSPRVTLDSMSPFTITEQNNFLAFEERWRLALKVCAIVLINSHYGDLI